MEYLPQMKVICFVNDFRYAYDWMTRKMIEADIYPAGDSIRYPVWAWYQWEGKRKRRDMRKGGHAKRGEKIVQLTIDIDDKDVLLSDFDLFHYPLNYWYLPSDEEDDADFESTYTNAGFTWHDLSDFQIQSNEMLLLRDRIVKSWDQIFNLSKEDEGWAIRKVEN
ncbi:hypothetical protein Desde_1695 [Desulfitobacterium dehalogenans ATCC 51507]|uniref:DUF3841 domain-containing protein n=2 Tax=Desulfitobacterium dehalogenans TaxID=36854 RepID=I4A812_DESDJ|nr:hypothetical protein Desde_1695 [Desulfitobacterium dehalogenans ATCC 51507]